MNLNAIEELIRSDNVTYQEFQKAMRYYPEQMQKWMQLATAHVQILHHRFRRETDPSFKEKLDPKLVVLYIEWHDFEQRPQLQLQEWDLDANTLWTLLDGSMMSSWRTAFLKEAKLKTKDVSPYLHHLVANDCFEEYKDDPNISLNQWLEHLTTPYLELPEKEQKILVIAEDIRGNTFQWEESWWNEVIQWQKSCLRKVELTHDLVFQLCEKIDNTSSDTKKEIYVSTLQRRAQKYIQSIVEAIPEFSSSFISAIDPLLCESPQITEEFLQNLAHDWALRTDESEEDMIPSISTTQTLVDICIKRFPTSMLFFWDNIEKYRMKIQRLLISRTNKRKAYMRDKCISLLQSQKYNEDIQEKLFEIYSWDEGLDEKKMIAIMEYLSPALQERIFETYEPRSMSLDLIINKLTSEIKIKDSMVLEICSCAESIDANWISKNWDIRKRCSESIWTIIASNIEVDPEVTPEMIKEAIQEEFEKEVPSQKTLYWLQMYYLERGGSIQDFIKE